jgi:2-haloacid dehalogenase
MPGREISTVVFDIGGVLLDWNPRHLYRKLLGDDAAVEDFLARICPPSWHLAHDMGADTTQSCQELARQYPRYADLIMAWDERSEEMIAGQLDDTIELLAELQRAGIRCLALSNMEPDRYLLRRDRYDFLTWFDGEVISGIEGVAKPDRKIFEILLDRFQLDPAGTAFLDDNTGNVAAARDLGIVAFLFTSAGQARHDLRSLGLPVTA